MFNIGDKVEIDIVAAEEGEFGLDDGILEQVGYPLHPLKKLTGTIHSRVEYDFLEEDLDAWLVGDILIDGEKYNEAYASNGVLNVQCILSEHLTKLD